jgi:hypothetical protein
MNLFRVPSEEKLNEMYYGLEVTDEALIQSMSECILHMYLVLRQNDLLGNLPASCNAHITWCEQLPKKTTFLH